MFKTKTVKIPQLIAEIHEIVKPFGFIAGGAVRSLLNSEEIQDIDIFLHEPKFRHSVRDVLLENGYREQYHNAIVTRFQKLRVCTKCNHPDDTKNKTCQTEHYQSAGFEGGDGHWVKCNCKCEFFTKTINVDLIEPREGEHVKTFGTPEEVISNFDFSVCRGALVNVISSEELSWAGLLKTKHNDGVVLIDEDLEKDIKTKTLRIKHIVCPVGSMRRAFKYQVKGYHLPTREMVKLFREWESRSELDKAEMESLLSNNNLSEEDLNRLYLLMKMD
jgi:hypothetical protein